MAWKFDRSDFRHSTKNIVSDEMNGSKITHKKWHPFDDEQQTVNKFCNEINSTKADLAILCHFSLFRSFGICKQHNTNSPSIKKKEFEFTLKCRCFVIQSFRLIIINNIWPNTLNRNHSTSTFLFSAVIYVFVSHNIN